MWYAFSLVIYVRHLSIQFSIGLSHMHSVSTASWGEMSLRKKTRKNQLSCLLRHPQSSRFPNRLTTACTLGVNGPRSTWTK